VSNRRIPTEPIGSVPRPVYLIEAAARHRTGSLTQADFDTVCDTALAETIAELEATGSPIITDGEQTKSSFVSYPLDGLDNLAPDGVTIPFADGHVRQLPLLTQGPFRYSSYAGEYVRGARRFTKLPLKQAVIAPSALSLLYPASGIKNYPREAFLEDLVAESEKDIRSCFEAGAETVQLDFTEGRLSVKLDPSRGLLAHFVHLNNSVLDRFAPEWRKRISVHTCPGGDQDSTHSADVDYADLLPLLFKIRAGAFMCALAAEKSKHRVLQLMRDHVQADQKVFVGVIDPLDPRIETPDEVAARVIEAAEYIPLSQLGVTDDCGFSPFGDDQSTARDIAFAKIRARIVGLALAEGRMGL
jgi:5-methyltetrahydropteroyltriglutamate--homocysteine methyltransferase